MVRVSLDILVVPEQDVVIQRTGEDLVVGSLGIVLRQRATHRLELELRMHRRDLFPRKTRRCRNVTGRRADLVGDLHVGDAFSDLRSEEHTSELQSLMRISYSVLCMKKTNIRISRQN